MSATAQGAPVRGVLDDILAGAARYLERRPRLPALFDAAARDMQRGLAEMVGPGVGVKLAGLALSAPDAWAEDKEAFDTPGVLVAAADWSGYPAAIAVDSGLMLCLVARALGDAGALPDASAKRWPSRIDRAVAQCLLEAWADALGQAFADVGGGRIALGAVSRRLDPSRFAGGAASLLAASFGVTVGEETRRATILVARAFIDAMGLAGDAGDRAEARPWAAGLESGIGQADVRLDFVLAERAATLGELMALRVGQVLALDATPQSLMRAECNEEPVLLCQLGRLHGRFTARVEKMADRGRSLADGLPPDRG